MAVVVVSVSVSGVAIRSASYPCPDDVHLRMNADDSALERKFVRQHGKKNAMSSTTSVVKYNNFIAHFDDFSNSTATARSSSTDRPHLVVLTVPPQRDILMATTCLFGDGDFANVMQYTVDQRGMTDGAMTHYTLRRGDDGKWKLKHDTPFQRRFSAEVSIKAAKLAVAKERSVVNGTPCGALCEKTRPFLQGWFEPKTSSASYTRKSTRGSVTSKSTRGSVTRGSEHKSSSGIGYHVVHFPQFCRAGAERNVLHVTRACRWIKELQDDSTFEKNGAHPILEFSGYDNPRDDPNFVVLTAASSERNVLATACLLYRALGDNPDHPMYAYVVQFVIDLDNQTRYKLGKMREFMFVCADDGTIYDVTEDANEKLTSRKLAIGDGGSPFSIKAAEIAIALENTRSSDRNQRCSDGLKALVSMLPPPIKDRRTMISNPRNRYTRAHGRARHVASPYIEDAAKAPGRDSRLRLKAAWRGGADGQADA
jgi:hypothetical protein